MRAALAEAGLKSVRVYEDANGLPVSIDSRPYNNRDIAFDTLLWRAWDLALRPQPCCLDCFLTNGVVHRQDGESGPGHCNDPACGCPDCPEETS